MATMTVMFEVDVSHSGDVMSALAPCMGVLQNFSMEAKSGPKRVVARHSKTEPIVMEALATAKFVPYDTIRDALEQGGYSRNSASPILSKFRAEGKVAYNKADDTWSLVQ